MVRVVQLGLGHIVGIGRHHLIPSRGLSIALPLFFEHGYCSASFDHLEWTYDPGSLRVFCLRGDRNRQIRPTRVSYWTGLVSTCRQW
jgi:hypothetical protein